MPRASWRGYLSLSLVSCPIALTPATMRIKSIRLHQVWRPTAAEEPGEFPDRSGTQNRQAGIAGRETCQDQ
jgi:DNA end-binding protein Ku